MHNGFHSDVSAPFLCLRLFPIRALHLQIVEWELNMENPTWVIRDPSFESRETFLESGDCWLAILGNLSPILKDSKVVLQETVDLVK